MKRLRRFREAYTVLLTVAVIFFGAIFGLLRLYGYAQNKQFEELEDGRRTALVQWQTQKIQTELAQLEGRMDAAAELIVESGLDPKDEWLVNYLNNLTSKRNYSCYYDSISDMEDQLRGGGVPENAGENLEELKAGRKILSDIRHSERRTGYYFTIARPVIKDGVTIGALRSVLPASALIQAETDEDDQLTAQCIVNREGEILYSTVEELTPGDNFLRKMEENNLDENRRKQLESGLRQDGNSGISVKWEDKHFMITASCLGYNGWSLIQVSDYSITEGISKRLMYWTAGISLALVAVALFASTTVFLVFLRQGERLRVEEQKVADLAAAFDTILFEYNEKADQIVMTPNSDEILELESIRMRGQDEWEKIIHPDDRILLEEAKQKKERHLVREIRLKQKGGEWIWCECRLKPLENRRRTGIYMGQISNIHERKMREIFLEEEKSTDPLTGLMNRAAFQAKTEQLFAAAGSGFLFMLDIDNFKMINDSMGHAAGDRLLCAVARELRNSFRDHDPVGRFGGDEFVSYMSDTDNIEYARAKADFIMDKLEKLSQKQDILIHVSIGISCFPLDARNYKKLFERADAAMYEAKKAGKNLYCFWREIEGQK